MPVTRKWDLEDLTTAIKYYAGKSRQLPTIEYVLFAGLNDNHRDARELKKLLSKLPVKINIIPYNASVPGYNRPDPEKVEQFIQWLLPLHAPVSVRWSKGDDINAACGQLRRQQTRKNISPATRE